MSFPPRLAALAALLLIGSGAMAQTAPPAVPSVQAPRPMPIGPADRALPPGRDGEAAGMATLDARVQQWLLNPNGEVDGLLLADGTQVAFPPHLSASVQQAMKLGDAVQVSGWRTPGAPVLSAARLNANGRSVVDQPPAPGSAPRDPAALTAMSASGRVARPLYTGRGDVNGVMLDDGSIVRFPPHVGAELAAMLQPGSTLHAKGWGSRGPLGSAIEATAIGPTADGLRALFAGPGMAPPPGPRGPAERGAQGRPLPPPGADRRAPPTPAS